MQIANQYIFRMFRLTSMQPKHRHVNTNYNEIPFFMWYFRWKIFFF